ncbi:histone acetyltransferase 1 [Allomyces arbusculus]|nr:histone acetyltransferase 1 [Allomyces arbusculus]
MVHHAAEPAPARDQDPNIVHDPMDIDDAPAPAAPEDAADHGHGNAPAPPPQPAAGVDLSNVLTLSLVIGHNADAAPPPPISFHPTATAAVHDEGLKDVLAGRPDPQVHVRFSAMELVPTVTGTEADAIMESMHQQSAPELFAKSEKQFQRQLRHEYRGGAIPPGKYVEDVVHDCHVYELYASSFFYPGFRLFFTRAKFLAHHFLDRDSASVLADLDDTDERWNFLLLYRQPPTAGPSIFVGLLAACTFFMYPPWLADTATHQRYHRRRISQLLVLPPFQRQGLASLLYSKFMSLNAASAHALEVAVEATTPAFDDLRDIADLTAVLSRADPNAPPLLHVPEVELLPLAKGDPYARARVHRDCARPVTDLCLPDVARDRIRGLQLEWKLEPRQAARVWEMAVLAAVRDARVPVPHELRMLVKQRLFWEGKADWVDVPRRERVEVLHRRYVAVMERYARIVYAVRARVAAQRVTEKGVGSCAGAGDGTPGGVRGRWSV